MGSTKCLSEYHSRTPPKAAFLLLSQKPELLGYRVRAVLAVGEKSKLTVLEPLFPTVTLIAPFYLLLIFFGKVFIMPSLSKSGCGLGLS